MADYFIDDPDRWYRVGRGRRFEFFATDEETQAWLLEALPEAFGPYQLVGYEIVKGEDRYTREPLSVELPDFRSFVADHPPGICDLFMRSYKLTPSLAPKPGVSIDVLCSLNGLVNIQHDGPRTRPYLSPSSISIVTRVRSFDTDEEVVHSDYEKVYNALARRIRRSLVYTTIARSKLGDEWVEFDSGVRMTEAAARAYEAGVAYRYRPAKRIRG